MQIAIYLLLGAGLMGGLYWALTQITARQRRLNAELTRLERLSAEVSMNAEALLEQIDERMEQLQEMLARVAAAAGAVTQQPDPNVAEAAPTPVVEAPAPIPGQRYQQMRATVWTLADQGKDLGEIARELGIPRGEAELLLNLRGLKVTT